jgi:hypothetical protein
VLGDSPDNPTYVETIPRRGYSFVAQVKFSSLPDAPPEANAVAELPSETAFSAARHLRAHIPALLRAASLLFAGMILGALLAFVWFFAQAKSQRAASVKVGAALPAHQPLRNIS